MAASLRPGLAQENDTTCAAASESYVVPMVVDELLGLSQMLSSPDGRAAPFRLSERL